MGESLADRVAPEPPRSRIEPGNPLSRQFWAFGGRSLAESEAAGSPVTHELDPRRGRSTPGFGLPVKELDILAVDDRAKETVVGALSMA